MTEPYYDDGMVTLYHSKFEEVLPELVALDADAVITDPPYGETSLDWDRWPDGWPTLAAGIAPVMWSFGSMRMFLDRAAEFRVGGWKLAQDTVWEKHNGSGFANDRFKRVHEFALHWYQGEWGSVYNEAPRTADAVRKTVRRKERPPHMGEIEGSTYTSVDGGDRLMRSVIKLRSMHGQAINETEKPAQLVEVYIEASVPVAGIVVDLFGGSCSTGIAARRIGRRAVICEMRESQCEAAAIRLQDDTIMPLGLEIA